MVTGCGGDDEPQAPASKSLFSSWAYQGSAGGILDFTGMKFGSQKFRIILSGAACDCTLSLAGTEESGNIIISQCTYNASASGGGADPGCSGLYSSGSYTKTADTLTVCDPGCGTYK